MTILLCGTMMAGTLPSGAMTVERATSESAATPESSRGIVAHMMLPEFTTIYSEIVANITIELGDEYLIEARGPEHIIRLIEPEVSKGGTLTIKSTKEYKIKGNNGVTIRIVTPTLDHVYNNGVGNIHAKGTVKAQMMTVTNEGVGNVTFDDLHCEILQVVNEGVGNINLAGEATKRAVFKSEGVGSINAYNLITPDLTAELEGVGSIECHATERFTCKADGVGSIYYTGNPKQTNISNEGIGKVRRK